MPIEEWANEFIYTASAKPQKGGATGKPSIKSAPVVCIRPEAKWAYHEQGEVYRKIDGGPNRLAVQHYRMTCGKEWKANRTW